MLESWYEIFLLDFSKYVFHHGAQYVLKSENTKDQFKMIFLAKNQPNISKGHKTIREEILYIFYETPLALKLYREHNENY